MLRENLRHTPEYEQYIKEEANHLESVRKAYNHFRKSVEKELEM